MSAARGGEAVLVAERVRVREIDDDEGKRLPRIIRRGSGSVVTWRRARMVLLSAQGMPAAKNAGMTFTSAERRQSVNHTSTATPSMRSTRSAGAVGPEPSPPETPGDLEVAQVGVGSRSAVRAFVSAVGRPRLSAQATHGDDRVGEIEEGVDDGGSPLVAAGEPVEGVLPGVGAFHVPTPTGLDWCVLTSVRDAAVEAALFEQSAGLVRVVTSVQVHGDVIGQRAEVVQAVQRGSKQRRVVAERLTSAP